LAPESFLKYTDERNSNDSNVQTVIDTVPLYILNDRAPLYWTSFDDEYIIMDSFDSDVDSTLQASKMQVWGSREPAFTISDSFIPDLPARAFPYLLSEAKSVSFNALKQAGNPKEEQRSRRQRVWLARNARKDGSTMRLPHYGRK
jgi:hypothetical protein